MHVASLTRLIAISSIATAALLGAPGMSHAEDTTAPSVAITSPVNGSAVDAWEVNVAVSASDDTGVTSVSVSADGEVVGTDTSAPYTVSYSTPRTEGLHEIVATATDAAGNTATSTIIVVTVNDYTVPSVLITSPVSGASVTGSTQVTVDAIDNVGVTSVALYEDGNHVGTDDTAPYSFTYTPSSAGAHTLIAYAFDAAGNGVASLDVGIVAGTTTPPDTTAPKAAISASRIKTSGGDKDYTVAVSATDNVGVFQVQLRVNGTVVGTDMAAPFSFVLRDDIHLVKGANLVEAFVSDAAGNTTRVTTTLKGK